MSRRVQKTFTLVLASVLTFLWCSETEARCWLRRRGCRTQATCGVSQRTRSTPCVCPQMRYATYPEFEQWLCKDCETNATFTRDYPLGTYMGMCPMFGSTCSYPCQSSRHGDRTYQTMKLDETDDPVPSDPDSFPGEPPRFITFTGKNYWFKVTNDDVEETYYVRVYTYILPRGLYFTGLPTRYPVFIKRPVKDGHQINQPAMSTEVTTVQPSGGGVYRLWIAGEWVRVTTTGAP